MNPDIEIISASAGTGKTYELCEIISKQIEGGTAPESIIATTFTKKAAQELSDRVRAKLHETGNPDAATCVDDALIGTVHSVCTRLLKRFAFEAGISPRLKVIDDVASQAVLNECMESYLLSEGIEMMDEIEKLALQMDQFNFKDFSVNWRKQVNQLLSMARSNAIDPSKLEDMGRTSADELMSHLPSPTTEDLVSPLLPAIRQAITAIQSNNDETQATSNAVDTLKRHERALQNDGLKWADWYQLAKLKTGKKSEDAVATVQLLASRVEQHPRLHADIRRYSELIFLITRETLDLFQQRKTARGLLDYTDLEVLTLDLLDQQDVRKCLKEDYNLLLVDEFQDTSPIQIALFLKLAGTVERTHWVGDTKQSIYAFRGSDPKLMQAAEQRFRQGKAARKLSTSYRHRPELVTFFNSLFPSLFGQTSEIREEEVTVAADREEIDTLSRALELWEMTTSRTGKTGKPSAIDATECISCLVQGVQIAQQKLTVLDPETKSPRKAEWRDMAILCRANTKATSIATALSQAGVPVSRETPGLLSTPEAVLALACLRWIYSDFDSVAVAEIISLENGTPTENWLADRLEWLKEKHGNWGLDGALKSDLLKRIRPLRHQRNLMTPSELLDAVIAYGGLEGICSRWDGNMAQERRTNLEALRVLALRYESSCQSAGAPVSLAGLLSWCVQLADKGKDQGTINSDANAVQVLTWHSSKGLEWPIVILMDLEDEPSPSLWNQPQVVEQHAFDPADPLGNRSLRFWPYPFGRSTKEVGLNDRIELSPAGVQAQKDAEAEQVRLQYVAMTRARDYLVIPTTGKNDPWTPDGAVHPAFKLSPIPDNAEGNTSRRTIRTLVAASDDERVTPAATPALWYPLPLPPQAFVEADLKPSAIKPIPGATVVETITYGQRIKAICKHGDSFIGDTLHGILSAAFWNPYEKDLPERAARILASHEVAADATAVLDSAGKLHALLIEKFQPTEVLVEVPFTQFNEAGQRLTGFIDLVLITPQGAVVIDHKTYQGSSLEEHAKDYSGQLATYRDCLVTSGHQVHSTWIHWCLQGILQECSSTH